MTERDREVRFPRTTEAQKTTFRVACEQAVTQVFQQARGSLWTLVELRAALRAARRKVFEKYGRRVPTRVRGRPGAPRVEGGPSAWRRAIVAVAGVPWRELREPKQSELGWRER